MKPSSFEKYVFVWPLCTRIIHWIIAISFFSSLYTSLHPHLFMWHLAFGYVFGFVLGFRMIWGFIGPSYATFKTFKLHFEALKSYFREKINNRWRTIYAGHNAASSWFTLLVIGFGLIIVISGILVQGVQEGSGFFAFLNPSYFHLSPLLFLVHKILSYTLLFWAVVHISGVLVEQFYHKTHMVFAMLSGYKKAQGSDAKVSLFHHIFAYGVILFSGFIIYSIVIRPSNIMTQSIFEKKEYRMENPLFYEKCTKCHKLYPPFMLPRDSWVRLMEGLENHFGERISEQNITKSEQMDIQAYLLNNAAEVSSQKLAFKTLQSIGDARPISMSKVPYWRKVHQHIDKSVYKRASIKSASNCFACHEDFDDGIMDILRIHVPQ